MTKERRLGILIGILLSSVLLVIAATSSNQHIETDLFADYDLMVALDIYRGTSQSSLTNVLWINTDTSAAPTNETSAAIPHTIVGNTTNLFICVSNNWLGAGINWGRIAVSTNW